MSRFKVGDKVRVYYYIDGSEETYTVHKIFNAHDFIPELNCEPDRDGYLWVDESGRFSWDEQFDVDNDLDMECTLVSSGEVSSPQPTQNDMYPHTCPRCGAPAYKGFNNIECSSCGNF